VTTLLPSRLIDDPKAWLNTEKTKSYEYNPEVCEESPLESQEINRVGRASKSACSSSNSLALKY